MEDKILAIDPGTTESAYVLWDGRSVLEKGKIQNEEMLIVIGRQGLETMVVIEMVASYGMAVGKDIFETVVWIGRFFQTARTQGYPVWREYRKDVKMFLCHSTRAKDSNIRQAIIDIFGKPGTKKNPNPVYQDSVEKMSKDIWQAFALALMFENKMNR